MSDATIAKIAVPLVGQRFSMHFGLSTAFAVFEVDRAQRKILSRVIVPLPRQHACGMAGWMMEHGVRTVVVGGLGRGALANLMSAGVEAFAGAPGAAPESLAQACLDGQLQPAVATCAGHDHSHKHTHEHDHDHGHEPAGSCHSHSHPKSE